MKQDNRWLQLTRRHFVVWHSASEPFARPTAGFHGASAALRQREPSRFTL
ncbi:hypothetical protein ACFOGG_05880 [Brenneria rubrifaciens]